uniref:DUF4283 domain-containing protein n=1 Tax=Ananas comosus var. bracteatus TaxID=296719 RepID=A0A6V7QMK8_ANACO|nr:unnamed protein product [Ananas comosus var. bracteatus]
MSTNLKALRSPRSLNTLLRRESSTLPLPVSRLTRKLSSLLHLRLLRRDTLLLRSLPLLFPLHPATSPSKVVALGAWEEITGLLFAATEFTVPARPSYLRAFVPLFDDFTSRQNRRRNAILVDVLPPANLGRFSQDTITNELANRFGGYPNDFHVARYSERDYVLFLPEWVPTERLIRRDVLNLGAFQLRCFPWNPYRGARRPPLTYKAWICLVSLPYECRSSRSMVALIGGFGRFIRPDDFSARMADLSGYSSNARTGLMPSDAEIRPTSALMNTFLVSARQLGTSTPPDPIVGDALRMVATQTPTPPGIPPRYTIVAVLCTRLCIVGGGPRLPALQILRDRNLLWTARPSCEPSRGRRHPAFQAFSGIIGHDGAPAFHGLTGLHSGRRPCGSRCLGSALSKAVHRKARLLEGETAQCGRSTRKWTRKKVKKKGLLCGVDLHDEDAKEFLVFLGRKA